MRYGSFGLRLWRFFLFGFLVCCVKDHLLNMSIPDKTRILPNTVFYATVTLLLPK